MVDRFSTALNAHCKRFNSSMHSPGTDGVDAFSLPWGGDNNWVNPPFSQAARALAKIYDKGATTTVLLPVWVAQAWWSPAVARAQQSYLLPATAGLFTSDNSQRVMPHPNWRLAVFQFVAGGRTTAQLARRYAAAERAHHRRHRFRRQQLQPGGAVTNCGRCRVPTPAAALMPLPPDGCATTA
eukprot:TRINITY_DN3106_c0_g1_i1.p5 TRINITY_DN3106_c0_g1~~TRINITY_DN3106_c0_g1_i1.p5  ORF type:complete len:183 (+),score=26.35 TRINITY_DN3106_c0_g1_i1:1781-2329(+)